MRPFLSKRIKIYDFTFGCYTLVVHLDRLWRQIPAVEGHILVVSSLEYESYPG